MTTVDVDALIENMHKCVEFLYQAGNYKAANTIRDSIAKHRAQQEEIARINGGAGWLAQMVIDKHNGTDDLPAWVRVSAKAYTKAVERASSAEAERDALRKDAERLSWLDRDDIELGFGVDPSGGPFVTITTTKGKLLSCAENIRDAIDAARAKEQKC